MSVVFRKLNLKDQSEILVLNAPASFEPELAALQTIAIKRSLEDVERLTFALAFVTKQQEVDSIAQAVARRAQGDAVVWFAYPKGSSKRYRCEFNRDSGWDVLGQLSFEAVRQVAIDEDWSALRFRRVEFVKTMIRDPQRAMTDQGKARVTKK
jgi:hypothetical protein